MFPDDKSRPRLTQHKRLVVYSVGVRNGSYVDHPSARNVAAVPNEFRLIEKAVLSTKLPRGLGKDSQVVTLASIPPTHPEWPHHVPLKPASVPSGSRLGNVEFRCTRRVA